MLDALDTMPPVRSERPLVFIDARFLVALDDYLNKYELWQTWRYLHSAWHGDQGSSL